eukprot:IDg16917t1
MRDDRSRAGRKLLSRFPACAAAPAGRAAITPPAATETAVPPRGSRFGRAGQRRRAVGRGSSGQLRGSEASVGEGSARRLVFRILFYRNPHFIAQAALDRRDRLHSHRPFASLRRSCPYNAAHSPNFRHAQPRTLREKGKEAQGGPARARTNDGSCWLGVHGRTCMARCARTHGHARTATGARRAIYSAHAQCRCSQQAGGAARTLGHAGMKRAEKTHASVRIAGCAPRLAHCAAPLAASTHHPCGTVSVLYRPSLRR